MGKSYYVYFLTNKYNHVLYTGVTSDLHRRVLEHKNGMSKFTKRYNVSKLVYFEIFTNADEAITREKQIKGGSRRRKINLINKANNNWEDLFSQLEELLI